MSDNFYDPFPPIPALLRDYRSKEEEWKDLPPDTKAKIERTWGRVREHFSNHVTPFPLDLPSHLRGLQNYVYDALWQEGWDLVWEDEERRDPFSRNFSVLWVSIPRKHV